MFKNYIKTFWRSLLKNRLTSSINILGLAVGIACASLAYLFIQQERSFDRFHAESENIYLLRTTIDQDFNLSATPGALGPGLSANFPEVADHLRLGEEKVIFDHEAALFKENVTLVESNFFDFFSFPLLSGDAKTALSTANNIVLSETIAQKYFGTTNPVGQSLSVYFDNKEQLLTVSGVAADAPTYSSLQFDFLMPLAFAEVYRPTALDAVWNNFNITTFVRLRQAADATALRDKMPAFISEQYPKSEDGQSASSYTYHLNSFENYHLEGFLTANGLLPVTDSNYVFILGIIALLILLVACLNFTNLSNAKGTQRLTEIGVRQVMGAARNQLRTQLLTESVFTSLVALVVAIGLVLISLRFTNYLFDYNLSINWWSPATYLPLLGITVATGLLAGAYPAILLSKLPTIKTFQSNYKIGGSNWVTKVGLVFQFTLSIGLLACTFVMLKQQRHLYQQDLGFDSETVVVVPTQVTSGDDMDTQQLLDRYRSELSDVKEVLNMAGTSYAFTQGNQAFSVGDQGFDFKDMIFAYKTDPNYIDLLDLKVLEGRNFTTDRQEDLGKTVIVNEAFKDKYVEGEIGAYRLPEEFEDFANATVVGVVNNHHFLDLRNNINPMLLHMKPDNRYQHLLVKIAPQNVASTLTQLESAWKTVRPGLPFDFSFLDEDIQQQYEEEARWSNVISGATLLAIFIGFLGLFGLVALSMAQRTKEIGIRKVLGASVTNIIALFSKDFIQLILIAFVIATPIAYYFMNQWLQNFAYQMEMPWWLFGLAGIVAVAIALLTIGFQGVKAALTNPVKSLRSE